MRKRESKGKSKRDSLRARKTATASTDLLREVALQFPDVEDVTTESGVAFKARGRLLTCAAIHGSAEPGSIVIRIAPEQRTRLMAAYPDQLYLPAHYAKHPAVLARLARLDRDSLRDILGAAWLYVAEKAVPAKRSGSRGSRKPARRS